MNDPKYMVSIAVWVTRPEFCLRVLEGRGDFDERLALAYVTWRYGTPTPERVADELAQLIDASKGGTRGHFRIVRSVSQWVEEFTRPVANGEEPHLACHIAQAFLKFNELDDSQHMVLSVVETLRQTGIALTADPSALTQRRILGDAPRLPNFQLPFWSK